MTSRLRNCGLLLCFSSRWRSISSRVIGPSEVVDAVAATGVALSRPGFTDDVATRDAEIMEVNSEN